MLMAHLLYDETPGGETASEETWAAVLETAWPYIRDDLERTWDGLSAIESGVVEAAALSAKGLTARDTRARFSLPAGSGAPRAAKRLADRGLLVADSQRPTGYRIVDPLFGRWVAAGRRWI